MAEPHLIRTLKTHIPEVHGHVEPNGNGDGDAIIIAMGPPTWPAQRDRHSVASRQGGPVAPGWPAGARWGDNVAGGAGRRCSGPARVAWRGYRGLAGLCHASVTAMELRDCAQIMLGSCTWASGHWHYERTLYSRRPLKRDRSFYLSIS